MKRVLLVDGNNLAFRCFIVMYGASGTLSNAVGTPTTVIFGLLRVLYAFAERDSVDECVVCWDGGSKYRKKLFKWYKYNREKAPWAEQYYEELNTTRKYFDKLGIKQMQIRGIEADDLIGYLSRHYRSNGDRVTVFSDDKDYFQLAGLGIKIYRPTKMELIDRQAIEERLGYPSSWHPKVVALSGEAKDNIPGIGGVDKDHIAKRIGMGPAKAVKLLTGPNGICRKLSQVAEAIDPKNRFFDAFKNNFGLVKVSYLLARIRTKESQYKKWEVEKLDEAMSKLMSRKIVERSMLSQVGEFLEFKHINLHMLLKKIGVSIR